jgi:hypothetical protein
VINYGVFKWKATTLVSVPADSSGSVYGWFFMGFPVPLGKSGDSPLKWAMTAYFYILCHLFFMNHPTIRRHIVRDIDKC